MMSGDKATITCPPDLAYGAKGLPGKVPPNSTLKYEVRLAGY